MSEQRRMWVAVAEGDGPDARVTAICRDPVVVRLALARAREELDRTIGRAGRTSRPDSGIADAGGRHER